MSDDDAGTCFFCRGALPENHAHEHGPGRFPVCRCDACAQPTAEAWGRALLRVGALDQLKAWNTEGVATN
jgi:hypothetical protein